MQKRMLLGLVLIMSFSLALGSQYFWVDQNGVVGPANMIDPDVRAISEQALAMSAKPSWDLESASADTFELVYPNIPAFNVNFGFGTGDTLGHWLKPLAGANVVAVRVHPNDFEGNILLTINGTDYAGDGWNAINGAGLLGYWEDGAWVPNDENVDGLNFSPIGEKIWPAGLENWPQAITAAHAGEYVTIPTLLGGACDVGSDPFMITFGIEQTAGWGFYAGDNAGTGNPNHFFKYYLGPGTSGSPGWHLRTFAMEVSALVEYYEDIPPLFNDYSFLFTTLSNDARDVVIDVEDFNPIDANTAGVASAAVVYLVDGGAEVEVALTDNGDGTWSGQLPGQSAGAEVEYYFTATDMNGNVNETGHVVYYIYAPEYGNLMIMGADWSSKGVMMYYYANGYGGENYYFGAPYSFVPEWDLWDAVNWGSPTEALLANYDNVIHLLGSHGGDEDASAAVHAWIQTATSANPKAYFLSGQDYGSISGYADTTFAVGTFEHDYLGVAELNNQDFNYPGSVADPGGYTYNHAWGVDAVAGSGLLDGMAAFVGDSLLGWYDPVYEIGITVWPDQIVPSATAETVLTDRVNNYVLAVMNEGTNWATSFWALDPLGLQMRADTVYDAEGDPENPYYWILDIENAIGNFMDLNDFVVSVEEVSTVAPEKYSLSGNYPNPFNPSTSFEFAITTPGNVKITLYNALGQQVDVLVDESKAAGTFSVQYDASHLASGVYLYTMEAENFTSTHKMLLLK